MTFEALINIIEGLAKKQPNVNTIVSNDVYKLNGLPDAVYSVFSWQAVSVSEDFAEDYRTAQLRLFYVDRLTSDDSNETNIQSTAIEVLSNIVRGLLNNEDITVEALSNYIPFTQRFNDNCAGAYVTINIIFFKSTICHEEYE